MNRIASVTLLSLLLLVTALVVKFWLLPKTDHKVAKFYTDAEALITGLQEYKGFTGSYPSGSNLEISKSLLGQTDKKVFILVVRKSEMNQKGEIVDPWGTPVQIFFAANSILIRSAGPNKAFEDSKVLTNDDLIRSQ